MEPDNRPDIAPVFPADYRGSGLMLHVASLPSPYGIGDFGSAALPWVDCLHAARQEWWHALPLGPTGCANSPYQPASSFAANELLISPDSLVELGLLRTNDCRGHSFPAASVDYDVVVPFKNHLIDLAWTNYTAGARRELTAEFEQFRHRHASWLDDYAIFRALKEQLGGAHHLEWPDDLASRKPEALAKVRSDLATQIDKARFTQFLVFRQAAALKEYAHSLGVRLVGDLPFFVSPDSSDVWAHPEFFLLDENRRPRSVAGAPPGSSGPLGQIWGNPVYNWAALRDAGFTWFIDRFRAALEQVDLLRLDHFRGFAAAWHVPAGAPNARCGQWVQGPGIALFTAMQQELGSRPFIVDDLGMITADVWHLLDQVEAPGTRVLQFAFDGHSDNPHLPANYPATTAVYTACHDTPTTRAWFETLTPHERRNLWVYQRRPGGDSMDAAPTLMGLAWSSRAALAIAPLADLLNIAPDARGAAPHANWHWRASADMLQAHAFEWLRQLTKATKRMAAQTELQLRESA